MPKLRGSEVKQLVDALCAAFPSLSALTAMVRFELDENLAEFAAGNLRDVAFALVTFAESRGRLRDLVDGAQRSNPGSPELRAFAAGASPASDGSASAPAPGPAREAGPQVGRIDAAGGKVVVVGVNHGTIKL